MPEGGNEKNSTATGGDDDDDEIPQFNIEDDGIKQQQLMNTI